MKKHFNVLLACLTITSLSQASTNFTARKVLQNPYFQVTTFVGGSTALGHCLSPKNPRETYFSKNLTNQEKALAMGTILIAGCTLGYGLSRISRTRVF